METDPLSMTSFHVGLQKDKKIKEKKGNDIYNSYVRLTTPEKKPYEVIDDITKI
jgi:hypothetical protein